MKLPRFLRTWREPHNREETRAHLARANEIAALADHLIEREQTLIRANHFGPRIAAALREGRR